MLANSLFKPKSSIGVILRQNSIHALQVNNKGKVYRTEWQKMLNSKQHLFQQNNHERLHNLLVEMLKIIASHISKKYVPIQLALPDPVVCYQVLKLEEMPKGKDAIKSLVQWKLAKFLNQDQTAIACDYQYIGANNGEHLVLAIGVDKKIQELVENAANVSGVQITVADMAACYRNNFWDNYINTDGIACISLDKDYWTLQLYDEQGRMRHAKSKWRHDDGDYQVPEMENIVNDAERSMRTYILSNVGQDITHVYINGADRDLQDFSPLLNKRMQVECKLLPAELLKSIRVNGISNEILSTSLCVAVNR